MPTIGQTAIGVGLNNFGTNAHGHINAALTYTAVADDVVTAYWAHGQQQGVPADGRIHLALYDFAGGLPVNRLSAEIELILPSAAAAWVSIAVNIPLTAGVIYTLCAHGDPAPLISTTAGAGNQESRHNNPTLPDPWTSDSINFFMRSYYAFVDNIPTPATGAIIYPCRAQLIT